MAVGEHSRVQCEEKLRNTPTELSTIQDYGGGLSLASCRDVQQHMQVMNHGFEHASRNPPAAPLARLPLG